MLEILKRNPLAAAIAVVMHIAIIAFMILGVDWLEKPVQPKTNVDVVQAKVIDQAKINAEVAKLKAAEDKKKAKEKAAVRKEEKRLADLKRKQKKEKQRLAELEKKRKAQEKAESKKRAEVKKKAEAEKKRKAALAKKKAEDKKRKAAEAKRKAKAEKKRKAVEAKKKAEAEKKRKAAEAAKRKAEAAARQAAEQKVREKALQDQLEAERSALERDRFGRAIKLKIEDNWLRPSTVGEGLSCEVRVRLMPGGGVAAVTITRSSGNGAFDRSVEQAVYKADPLPVPTGVGFEAFRDLNFVFDPSK